VLQSLFHKDKLETLLYDKTVYDLPFRYLLATLSANDGSMIKTVINNNRDNSMFISELSSCSPGSVKTIAMPMMPKTTDA
jgi:hypothetical protein